MADMVDTIAAHVRAEYSHVGVEVGATGQRSLTLQLPQQLHVTELTSDLWNTFGATCELKQHPHGSGASLVVWLDQGAPVHASTNSSRAWLVAGFMPLLWLASMHTAYGGGWQAAHAYYKNVTM